MCRRRFLIIISLLLAIAVIPWGDGQVRAQSNAVEKSDRSAAMERLKERAERVQAKRKARISHNDRQAAAERAKAAREKGAAGKTAPAQDGKGVAK